MSLNWQFTDKKRFAALSEEEKKSNHCFVWGCLYVDLGQITEKNAKEWYERYLIANEKTGPFYFEPGNGQKVWTPSLEDVQKRIGLQTNVTTKTRAFFNKKIARIVREELDREARLAVRP